MKGNASPENLLLFGRSWVLEALNFCVGEKRKRVNEQIFYGNISFDRKL